MFLETVFHLIYRLLRPIVHLITGDITPFWEKSSFQIFLIGYKTIAGIFIAITFTLLVYVLVKLVMLGQQIQKKEGAISDFGSSDRSPGAEQWDRIMKKLHSDSEAEWKMAIIEADGILGEILRAEGYVGEDIGEMLKSVEPSDFLTLESAWEAHKIRNSIAHDTMGIPLSHREAKRVIGLYEKIFREFTFI